MFDPVRSYDKPGVIIGQLINGVATTSSVRGTLFDPSSLSPRERKSFADSMKESVGGGDFVDAAIDVVTNPFVWLGLLAAAAGAAGSRNVAAGKRFFSPETGLGAYGVQRFPFLRAIGLTSGATEAMGTATPHFARLQMRRQQRTQDQLVGHVQDAVTNLLQRLEAKHGTKVTSLDPHVAANDAIAHDLQLIRTSTQIHEMGLYADRNEDVVGGVSPGRYHVRVIRDNPDPTGKAKSRGIEVDRELFNKLREMMGKDRSVMSLDTTTHQKLFMRMRGLVDGENMLESLERLGLKDARIKLGLKEDDVVPGRSAYDARLDRSSLVEGGPRVDWVTKKRKRWVRDMAAINAVNAEFGLRELHDAQTKLFEHGRVLLMGNEEAYAKVFTVHYPDEERPGARPLKTAPCYSRMKALGAVFGTVSISKV